MNSELKLKKTNFDNSTYRFKEKLNHSKSFVDLKLYQKLPLLILTLFLFLIIPESPQDSEILCKKYNSLAACIVW